jgi:hypothetical protein
MYRFVRLVCICAITTPFVTAGLGVSLAQVMESGNYQIQSDSINFGGGLSSSTNYRLESTGGEVATGESASTNYQLRAGYQQMQEVYLSLSSATDIVMSPALSGVTGGISNGSTTVTVITDSPAGYSLSIESSSAPAMVSGSNTIADYTPGGAPDFSFITGITDAHFGYTPEGVDIVSRFRDNGSLCNSSNGDTQLACWDGLSTTPEIIATSQDSNHPDGSTTTIAFRVGIGGSVGQAPGVYTATTTLTALPL